MFLEDSSQKKIFGSKNYFCVINGYTSKFFVSKNALMMKEFNIFRNGRKKNLEKYRCSHFRFKILIGFVRSSLTNPISDPIFSHYSRSTRSSYLRVNKIMFSTDLKLHLTQKSVARSSLVTLENMTFLNLGSYYKYPRKWSAYSKSSLKSFYFFNHIETGKKLSCI